MPEGLFFEHETSELSWARARIQHRWNVQKTQEPLLDVPGYRDALEAGVDLVDVLANSSALKLLVP